MHLVVSGLRVVSLVLFLSAVAALPGIAHAQSLSTLAKQQGCTGAPVVVEGTDLYKCQTNGAMSYFSGPPSGNASSTATKKNPTTSSPSAPRAVSPTSFPRVDSNTQRERDDVRKRVLTEELATEVRMMVESEVAMKVGSSPLPDESLTSPKYLDRQAKLRNTVQNHNRNVQALNKELERLK